MTMNNHVHGEQQAGEFRHCKIYNLFVNRKDDYHAKRCNKEEY